MNSVFLVYIMTSISTDNRGSPSTTDIENGASEKTTQDVEVNRDEGQAAVDNNIEEAADTNDNDDGKIVYVAILFCLY